MAAPVFIGGLSNRVYPKDIAITSYVMADSFVGTGMTFGISPAPPTGLTFNTSTGTLTGTPTANTAQTVYTITATNADGAIAKEVRLRVVTPNFYIATAAGGGSDSNPGTRASPWLTFAKASATITAGQIVMVRGGTYAPAARIEFSTPGTAGNLKEYIGHPDEVAIVSGSAMTGVDIFGMYTNYIALRHLTMQDAKLWAVGFWDAQNISLTDNIVTGCQRGCFWMGGSTRTAGHTHTIEDNVMFNNVLENVDQALGSGGWGRAIACDTADNSVLRRNRIFENWGEGLGVLSSIGVTIEDNIIYDNFSVNLYLDNTQDCTATGNIIFNSEDPKFRRTTGTYAIGCLLADEAAAAFPLDQDGMTVTGNTLVGATMVAPFYDGVLGGFGRNAGITNSTLTPNTVSNSIANLDPQWHDQRWPKVMVRGRATGRTTASDVTSHPITLPTGIVAGEKLVVLFAVDGDPTVTVDTGVSGANWTKTGQSSNGTIVTLAVFEKTAEGGDVLTLTTSTAQQSSHASRRMANSGAIDCTFANGSSTNSNPPSHTPALGLARYLWQVARAGDSTVVATVAPTGFGLLQSLAAAGTAGASISVAERHETLSVKDPAVFTSATEQWVTATIAVQALSPQPIAAATDFVSMAATSREASTNLQDSALANPPTLLTDLDEGPDAPDGLWWTAIDPTQATSARLGFGTPTGTLSGTQTFRAFVRATDAGISPMVTISLYEAGVLVRDLLVDEPVTSAIGQVVEGTWQPSELADQSGADVEILISSTPG